MSKAFDTVNRELLLTDLEEILTPDELHLLSMITNRPEIQIKLEDQLGETFETYQGIMQGDCLSAVLFIIYLAYALADEENEKKVNELKENEKKIRKQVNEDHSYATTEQDTKQETTAVNINPKYADDCSYITTENERFKKQEQTSQTRLLTYNLGINRSKTEKFTVPEPPPPPPLKPSKHDIQWSDLDWTLPSHAERKQPAWNNMKILGTHIITETDINSRKGKAMYALKSNNKIFKSNKISNNLKMRVFECYVSSAFLYNSETWSLTKTKEDQIDAFHRKLLRYALNKQYPNIISNKKLYDITRVQPWSNIIRQRRLNTLGHILRLPQTTPVQQALKETTKTSKKNVGHPRNTWLKTIQNDTKHITDTSNPKYMLRELTKTASERDVWRGVTNMGSVMSRAQ